MSLTLIPPRTGEGAGFYDDDEQNDRIAAQLIGEALGNTALTDGDLGGEYDASSIANFNGLPMQTTTLPFGLGNTFAIFRVPPRELPD